MSTSKTTDDDLLDAAVTVPEHVIFREFASETVALNIVSGQFHGLNLTAGRMVHLARRAAHARDAIGPLAAEYGVSAPEIERDLVALLRQLLERELIELHA
jgi:hypothetical protein